MISIKKYLRDQEHETEAALRRALGLLLQLIELHAVEGDEIDYALFRRGIHESASRFSDETPPEDVMIIVGEVATAIKEYGERTTRYRKAQAAEYQRMLAMLTNTITETSHASEQTIVRLQTIEKKLERAAVIEDVRLLRMQLDECLGSIREEIRCCQQTRRLAGKSDVPQPVVPVPAKPAETDAATGLPARAAAERALDQACKGGTPCYAVAFVPNRLESINSRFGNAVGDRVLRSVSDQLRTGLSAGDCLFRWSESCLLTLLVRPSPEHTVHAELQRIMSARHEDVLEIGSRSVLLQTTASWAIFSSNEPARIIRDKIDRFAAAQRAAH